MSLTDQFASQPEAHGLCFSDQQTVPRWLVHKNLLENVFLTEIKNLDGRILCRARPPRLHRFFNDTDRCPANSILFYTEVARQASLAISHLFLDVCQDHVFIFERSQAELTQLFPTDVHTDAEALLTVELHVKSRTSSKSGDLGRIVAEHFIRNEHGSVFHATGSWTVQAPILFSRLRKRPGDNASVSSTRHTAARAAKPGDVGRDLLDNVVISYPDVAQGNQFIASLIVDQDHPYFFDHACDHVPAMLLLEGCAQVSIFAASRVLDAEPKDIQLCAYVAQFRHFVEHSSLPILLKATLRVNNDSFSGMNGATVDIEIIQNDAIAGKVSLDILPYEHA